MKPVAERQLATLILLACGMLVVVLLWQNHRRTAPDFSVYPAGEQRKAAFFDYLKPIIDQENQRWREQRERLLDLRVDTDWNKRDQLWVKELIGFFEVPSELARPDLIDELLEHVDTVPRSLALAQAAKESAWGTSRFAVDGNNYFGQRCHEAGCGMVPDQRPEGASFEVRRFDSPAASVSSYMSNINSHPEYEALRRYRAARHQAGGRLSGLRAAERLSQYSERRQAYVDEIQSLIHFNKLEAPP